MSAANSAAASANPMLSKQWSCDTLLRGSSFLAEQQAQFKGKPNAKEILEATCHVLFDRSLHSAFRPVILPETRQTYAHLRLPESA